MKKHVFFLLIAAMFSMLSAAELTMYAAPEAAGKGDGSSAADAARFWDVELWKNIQKKLADTPVTLQLLPGKYLTQYPSKPDTRINLYGIGNAKNQLIIRGADKNGTVFGRHPEDSKNMEPASRNLQNWITLRKNCQNIVFEKLYFTGNGACGYPLQVRDSVNITIRDCHWKDMRGVYYGASGANGNCKNITWENCTFDDIGYNVHAHMLYNTNGCQNLTVRNCTMIDAYGDYIRFRNQVDQVTVEGCTFIDNGKYATSPFIAFPLFNTQAKVDKGGEFFSTGLTVRNNRFEFKKKAERNWMMCFHNSGFNPPGRKHMLSKKDIAAFQAMDRNAQRKFLDDNMGLMTGRVKFENNTLVNTEDAIVYECWPLYGAEKLFPVDEYRNSTSLTKALN